MTKHVVAALQIGADPKGTQAILAKILSFEDELKEKKVELVVLPEAILGGYPKGSTFGTHLGYRLPEGRQEFAEYFKGAVEVPGPETDQLASLSASVGASIVIGVIERAGSTLYCTAVYIDRVKGYVGKHRKVMPTASERLIWGQGDGSTLFTTEFDGLSKVGGAICWENYMPLLRASFYAKGIHIYTAPTVDDRDGWTSLIRTIGNEGRLFAVSAVQFLPTPEVANLSMPGWPKDKNAINGGSVIVNPYGDIIAGPLRGTEGLLTAEIDLDTIIEARYDFDPVGHYSRGDIFQLTVDERAKPGVTFN
ncbi:nitrilase [Scheffersomyces xylosifermentans]|uniref:nitrilase n=1 Tax=Scheffersomyces xylosifermentans TaxID=1304137 RepID=UPI00315D090D